MRAAILVAIVLVFGCHKPTRQRFSDKLAAMRDKLVTVVRPAGGGTVNVDLKTLAAARKEPRPAPRDDRPPPAQTTPARTPTPAPTRDPTPTPIKVDRVDASRATVFVLRGETHGGKDFCETHTTLEACNSACTAMLRQNAFTKPGPESPRGCACTELDKGC